MTRITKLKPMKIIPIHCLLMIVILLLKSSSMYSALKVIGTSVNYSHHSLCEFLKETQKMIVRVANANGEPNECSLPPFLLT